MFENDKRKGPSWWLPGAVMKGAGLSDHLINVNEFVFLPRVLFFSLSSDSWISIDAAHFASLHVQTHRHTHTLTHSHAHTHTYSRAGARSYWFRDLEIRRAIPLLRFSYHLLMDLRLECRCNVMLWGLDRRSAVGLTGFVYFRRAGSLRSFGAYGGLWLIVFFLSFFSFFFHSATFSIYSGLDFLNWFRGAFLSPLLLVFWCWFFV